MNRGFGAFDPFDDFFGDRFSRRDPFVDMFRSVDGMMQEMERLMQNVTDLQPPIARGGHFEFDQTPAITDGSNNPRSQMLKVPDECDRNPQLQPSMDLDFDDRVAKYGLRSVLESNSPFFSSDEHSHQWKPVYHSSNFSFKKVISSDGKVEEHRVQRDHLGNKMETITRSLGDKTYSVTTKENAKGEREENQSLYNMSEEELSDFEKQWNRRFNQNTLTYRSESDRPVIQEIEDKPKSSMFNKLFGWLKPK